MRAAGLRPDSGGRTTTTRMPNFLIIGAAKSGTTSLYYYLKQHPQIYMSPKKELRFFALEGTRPDFRGPNDEAANRDAITTVEEYRKYFEGARGEKALGEASPFYLSSPVAASNIRRHIPGVKLIAVLRHPAERAHSSFMHMVRDGYEPLKDFAAALRDEERRVADGWSYIWHYKRRGFYAAQLARYFELFDASQFRIYLYEDFCADPRRLLQDIFRFLEVDDDFAPDISLRHNVSGVAKNRALQNFLVGRGRVKSFAELLVPERVRLRAGAAVRRANVARQRLDPRLRAELVEDYREDILRLQELTGRDLSHWLS